MSDVRSAIEPKKAYKSNRSTERKTRQHDPVIVRKHDRIFMILLLDNDHNMMKLGLAGELERMITRRYTGG